MDHRVSKNCFRSQTASQFNSRVMLCCLVIFATLATTSCQAEPIAQAHNLPAASNANALLGVAGAYPSEPVARPVVVAQKATPVADADDNEPVDLLGEFNVTAQRRRTTERENTQTTYIVNKEDIKASGAATISDALSIIPGFALADALGGLDNRGNNFFRGFDDQRFVLLQDGRPLGRSSNNRASDISKLPVFNVDRIEVVTGGGTLRYGADAIAGVINIITTIPSGPPKLRALAEFGSYGFSNYALEYSGGKGDPTEAGFFGYQVGYVHTAAINSFLQGNTTVKDPFGNGITVSDNPSGLPGNSTSTTFQGSYTFPPAQYQSAYTFSDFYYGKLIFKPAKEHTITIYAQQQNTRRSSSGQFGNRCSYFPPGFQGSPLGGPGVQCYTTNYLKPYYTTNLLGKGSGDSAEDEFGLNLTWDWNLSELNTLTTQIFVKNTFGDNAFISPQNYVVNRNITAQVRYTAQLYPGNVFNAGFEFRTDRSTQSTIAGEPFGVVNEFGFAAFDKERSSWALYATEDLKLFDDAVIVNFGSRITTDIFFGTYTTSGAGIRYNFGGIKGQETFGLRANWQQSFKVPGLSQLGALFTTGNPPTAIDQPNPNLKPENGVSYDIGFDIQVSPTAVFRASYYRIDLTNRLTEGVIQQIIPATDTTPQVTITAPENLQAQKTVGWDFLFDWRFDPKWRVTFTESIVDATAVGDPFADPIVPGNPLLGGGLLYGYPLAQIPYHTTGMRLTYADPGFTAALSGNLVGDTPVVGTYAFPSYSRFDLTARAPLGAALTLTGGVFDIFNSSNRINAPGTTFRVGMEASF